MDSSKIHLIKDLIIIILSVLAAIVIVKTGIVENFLASVSGFKYIASFLAGIFFASLFTVAPATVVLAEIAQSASVIWVAVLGGLGALVGDLIIFRFIESRLTQDVSYLLSKSRNEKLKSILHLRLFRWSMVLFGALVIASPLPDEIGLAMMGLSKVKTLLFIPISFSLNAFGILIIGLIARTL